MTFFLVIVLLVGILYFVYHFTLSKSKQRRQPERKIYDDFGPDSVFPTSPPVEHARDESPLISRQKNHTKLPVSEIPENGEKSVVPEKALIPSVSAAQVNIDDYLNRFEEDRLQYELINHYNDQFNLQNDNSYPNFTVKPIKSLVEIGITGIDIEEGKLYLVNKYKFLSSSESAIRWDDALQFLHRYSEINACIRGLKQLESSVSNRELYNELLTYEETRMQDLIKLFK